MICSLTNKCSVILLVDLTDGTEKLLHPGDSFLYEDCVAYPTEETWILVEHGLLEDRDDEFAHANFYSDLLERRRIGGTSPLHNWLQEGF
jgi:hypothetical protein